jgi:hypothetical protein
MKSLNDVTLYDLMAEDLDVWLGKNKEFGFVLQIDDENGEELVDEKQIHPNAAWSLADFCRRYLHSYDRITNKESS